MATRSKEVEEYFSPHPEVGYGEVRSGVRSAPEHGCFTTVSPKTASFESTGGQGCDVCMGNTPQRHAHKVFDGRLRVSLGQEPGGMTHGCCNSSLEMGRSSCEQSKSTNPSEQPSRWRNGHQVFEEMPLSSFGQGQSQGRIGKVPATSLDIYNSCRSTGYAGLQSELLSRASDSGTHQMFEIMPHIHSRVLSVKIHMMTYPVTSDVLYQVFSAYGAVEMIIPINSSIGDRVLIQYQHEQMAGKAHKLLHGRYIYQSCCQLDIRYAHEAELKILHPFKCTAQPSLDDSTIGVKYSLVEGSSAVDNPSPQELEALDDLDGRVLAVRIHHTTRPLTLEVLYQVFSAYGIVENLMPNASRSGCKILIMYQQDYMASEARRELHERCVYQSCCELDIQYAKKYELRDLYEAMCSAKFSSSMSTFEENNATVPCTKIVAEKIMPQVLEQSPSTSLDQGINVEKNNQVILNEISNFVAEWRSKIEQEERSRTEQSELKSELEYFLYHAFDIFQDESESEMVLEMERKERKTKEQLRIEQEERETELDYFLYQAFDLFGEELESVLEKQNDKIAPKHGVGTVVGINCGANLATKCEVPQECLMLYSQPLSDFASRVEDSLNHVFGKQLENQKLNHVEPRMHWEPGDQEEGSKLMKLTVESQLLKREEIQGIPILLLNRSCQSKSFLELYLQEKLKEILCCNCMSGGGKSKILTVPWDPGEQENIFIFARIEYSGSATTITAPVKSCGEDFTVLVLRIINMGSVSGRNDNILMQTRISSKRIIIAFTCQDDYWGTHFTLPLFLSETREMLRLVDFINMLPTEIITEPDDLYEKLASTTESMHKIRRQMCVTQCAASNYFGLSLQNDSELSWWDISLLIRTNWQWDPGTVTSTFAVLKQSIWAMDIHFYQSILSPEIEYHWQFVALTSCDSSVQVRNDFCWWKLSLEMKLGWQWDTGIAGHSQAVLKANLWAKDRIKKYADKNRKERELAVGDMVYLKIQPYRHTSLSLHRVLKLHFTYYGPFRVIARVGEVAYKLLLPEGCQLHPTFHVSQLKKHIGKKALPSTNLPLIDADGNIQVYPVEVKERRVIPRNNEPVVQWLIQWVNLPETAVTWEDAAFIAKIFPQFYAETVQHT